MAVSTCTVSGKLVDTNNTAVPGATVRAYCLTPYLYGDGTLVTPSIASTTTAADGTWSLSCVENATTSTQTIFAFDIPNGSGNFIRQNYAVTVPNTGTATFASLTPVG